MTDQKKPREFWIQDGPVEVDCGAVQVKIYQCSDLKPESAKKPSIHVREVMSDQVTLPAAELTDQLVGDVELCKRLDRVTRALEKAKEIIFDVCYVAGSREYLKEIEAIERGEA